MRGRESKKRKRKQAPMHVGAANLCALPPSSPCCTPLHTLEYKTCIPKWLSNFTFTLPLQTTTRSREDNKRARDGKREQESGGGNNTSGGALSSSAQLGAAAAAELWLAGRQVAKPTRSACILCILRASACCLSHCVEFILSAAVAKVLDKCR